MARHSGRAEKEARLAHNRATIRPEFWETAEEDATARIRAWLKADMRRRVKGIRKKKPMPGKAARKYQANQNPVVVKGTVKHGRQTNSDMFGTAGKKQAYVP